MSMVQPTFTGASLADGLQGLHDAVSSGSWVDGLLAGGAFALDAASTVLDPFSALAANGLGWAMEHFAPLREVLDALTGLPDVVTSHAETWHAMAGALRTMAGDLYADLASDLPDWSGTAAGSYLALMRNNVDGLGALGVLASTMSAATLAAGNLVSFTRDVVRDLIADLVARVIVWAAEAVFVVTIPVVAAQIAAAVVKWAGRILSYPAALLTSLANLRALMTG